MIVGERFSFVAFGVRQANGQPRLRARDDAASSRSSILHPSLRSFGGLESLRTISRPSFSSSFPSRCSPSSFFSVRPTHFLRRAQDGPFSLLPLRGLVSRNLEVPSTFYSRLFPVPVRAFSARSSDSSLHAFDRCVSLPTGLPFHNPPRLSSWGHNRVLPSPTFTTPTRHNDRFPGERVRPPGPPPSPLHNRLFPMESQLSAPPGWALRDTQGATHVQLDPFDVRRIAPPRSTCARSPRLKWPPFGPPGVQKDVPEGPARD